MEKIDSRFISDVKKDQKYKSIKELFLEIAAAEGERNVYSIKRRLNALLLKEGRARLDDLDMYELIEAAGWLD